MRFDREYVGPTEILGSSVIVTFFEGRVGKFKRIVAEEIGKRSIGCPLALHE